ncbi:OmpA family protein [candidate division FCPU426 bacterium]|nr:OmpA family protein [candidate division FCPU426 bacterium]
MRKMWLIYLLCFCLGLTATAFADESVLSTAGKILQVGIGPRQVAMGEANVAAVDDVYALYWNPAGLSNLRSAQISYMHNLWLQDIQDAYITYGQRLFDGGLGVSINYFNFGEFEKIDVDPYGYPLPTNETFTPYTLVVAAGYGTLLTEHMPVGASLKLINESVDTFSSMTIALDLGAQYLDIVQGLDAGLMIQNLGVPLEGYQLPLNVRMGLAYKVPVTFAPQDSLITVMDVTLPIPLDQPFYTNLGLEYSYLGIVAGRVGYKIAEINNLGSASGLTAGLGVSYMNFALDYAIAPFGELGTTHRIALTYDILPGKQAKKARRVKKHITVAPQIDGIKKTPGGIMLPTDQTGAKRQVLLPQVSKMEMRKTINVEITSRINPKISSKVDKAVFEVKIAKDKKVKSWVLRINDAGGKTVRKFAGKGQPPAVEWDGKGQNRAELKETIFCRYVLQLKLEDGSEESVKGAVVEKAEREKPQTPDQQMLARVYFSEGAADLSEEAISALKKAAQKIQSQPFVKILVEGYTDGGGENPMAFLLSQRRAEAVSRYLTATYKIPLMKISTHARGTKNPLASNQSEKGRERNRRVEVTIIYRQ